MAGGGKTPLGRDFHGNCGLVIRTNGETAGLDAVFAEFESLFERYREICRIAASRTCCSVLHRPRALQSARCGI